MSATPEPAPVGQQQRGLRRVLRPVESHFGGRGACGYGCQNPWTSTPVLRGLGLGSELTLNSCSGLCRFRCSHPPCQEAACNAWSRSHPGMLGRSILKTPVRGKRCKDTQEHPQESQNP